MRTITATTGRARKCRGGAKKDKLIEYEGGPHGVCTTEKDRISADSLSFLKSQASLPDLGTLIADGSLGHTLYIEGYIEGS
jgi:hypothetical protein